MALNQMRKPEHRALIQTADSLRKSQVSQYTPLYEHLAAYLEELAERHSPTDDTQPLMLHYDSSVECRKCDEEIGHECYTCEHCMGEWDEYAVPVAYPCPDVRAALELCGQYLGGMDPVRHFAGLKGVETRERNEAERKAE